MSTNTTILSIFWQTRRKLLLLFFLTQKKILHTRRPKLKFLCTTRCTICESQLLFFFTLSSKMENKEYHHGGFQQESPPHAINRYKHMNRRHNCMILRLKVVPLAQFFVQYSIHQSNTIMMTFDQLRFSKQEWSTAP